ncbi:MAG: DUF3592 domain-containing protein [Candidatus Sericytochromatia bacterium]
MPALSVPMLDPPPRKVPVSLLVKLLLGSFLSQWGWCFLACSGLLILACIRGPDWDLLRMTPDRIVTVQGRLITATAYSSTHGTGYSYDYVYQPVSGGPALKGLLVLGKEPRYVVGTPIKVEYLREKPQISQIPEHRTSAWALWAMAGLCVVLGLMFGALMLASLAAIWSGWREGWQTVQVLRHGQAVEAVLLSVQGSLVKPLNEGQHSQDKSEISKDNSEVLVEYDVSFPDGSFFRQQDRTKRASLHQLLPDRMAPALAVQELKLSRLLALLPLKQGRMLAYWPWCLYALTPPVALLILMLGILFKG